MKVIGITGKAASGKSYILNYLKTFDNICVLELDKIANEYMKQEETLNFIHNLMKQYGKNDYSREVYRELFFNNVDFKKEIEDKVHPYVKEYCKNIIDNSDKDIIFIESAIILKVNYDDIIDEYWEVYCEETTRLNRLKNRNLSKDIIDKLMKIQEFTDVEKQKISCRIKSEDSLDDIKRIISNIN